MLLHWPFVRMLEDRSETTADQKSGQTVEAGALAVVVADVVVLELEETLVVLVVAGVEELSGAEEDEDDGDARLEVVLVVELELLRLAGVVVSVFEEPLSDELVDVEDATVVPLDVEPPAEQFTTLLFEPA